MRVLFPGMGIGLHPDEITIARLLNDAGYATAMDLYTTIASWCGVDVPDDRIIDGRDISDVLEGKTAESPHEAIFEPSHPYYMAEYDLADRG